MRHVLITSYGIGA